MLTPGSKVGRYRVEELAGVGGMGAVYRATDTVLERPVALKVMLAEGDSACDHDRLRDESLHAARLSHPHIVPVYDADVVDGTSYVAMQWVEGETLEERIARDGHFPAKAAVGLVEQVAGALDHAHEHGVVHRDVRADNVMVDELGIPYLMDFGLGRQLTHVAPEQRGGGTVDRRADVYGLGALAYHLLTGDAAFGSVAPSARDAVPEVPAAVSEAVRRAMAEDPAERPATAGELAAAMRSGLGEDTAPLVPVAAAAAPAAAVVAAPAEAHADDEPGAGSRRRRTVAALAVTAAAAIAGVSFAVVAGDGLPKGGSPPDAEARDAGRDGKDAKTTTTSSATTATTSSSTPGERKRDRKKRRDRDRERQPSADRDGGSLPSGDAYPTDDGSAPAPAGPQSAPANGTPSGQAPAPNSTGGGSGSTTPTSTQPATTEPQETTPETTEEPPPAETTEEPPAATGTTTTEEPKPPKGGKDG